MTAEYGVTEFTAWHNYFSVTSDLIKTNHLYQLLLNYETFVEIFNIIKNNSCDTLFYHLTKEEWSAQHPISTLTEFTLSDISIPIAYYQPAHQVIYYEHPYTTERTRNSLSIPISLFNQKDLYWKILQKRNFKNFINMQKTNNAKYVNIIHALDALYLRNIALYCLWYNIPIATIHDGFALPYIYGSWILSAANKAFFQDVPNIKPFFIKDTIITTVNSSTIII
jgi:hypothetical protein